MAAPSADFQATADRVITYLRTQYPDPRARQMLAAQDIAAYGSPTDEDWRLAGTYGRQPEAGDLLLGLHVGGVGQLGEIRVYEDGIRGAAARRGLTVDAQLANTLLHEAEHSLGVCPSGHLDCSREEVARTYALGGWLDPEQVATYSARGYIPSAAAPHLFTVNG